MLVVMQAHATDERRGHAHLVSVLLDQVAFTTLMLSIVAVK